MPPSLAWAPLRCSPTMPPLRQLGPFGHDDQRELLAVVLALENLVTDAFKGPGNLGNQNHVAAAGHARVQRDPAGVPAHHLQHEHPLVAGGRRVEPIEGVGRAVDRAVEAEREGRGRQVVVDRLRDADDRDAELVELLGDGQRAVAADANQSFEAQLLDRRGDAFEQLAA